MRARIVALLAAAVPFLLVACSEDAPPDWVAEARQKSGRLGSELISALSDALSEQGPAGGIQVCNIDAPEIAERVSGSRFEIGRTALRVRNLANAPDDWEESMLRHFEARIKEGADPAGLEAWQVESIEGDGDDDGHGNTNRVGRYMKAIPTGPQCVACHGKYIAPELTETIKRLYPQDQATGFAAGDLRGAFTVTVELPASD